MLEIKTKQDQLLERVKEAVLEIEPSAEIILYGSRARGDAEPDSDWDFLILVDGPVDEARKTKIRLRLYKIERDMDEVLCSIIHNRVEWNSYPYNIMPFHKNVTSEGKEL